MLATAPYGEAERTGPSSHLFRWSSMAGGISAGRCDKADSTGNEMKALMAAIALLCVSSTVLAHDIYSNLRDRDGNLCCNGQDCTPVQATVLPNGDYYLPSTGEIIPADMATPSPDDRFHHCGYYPILYVFDPLFTVPSISENSQPLLPTVVA